MLGGGRCTLKIPRKYRSTSSKTNVEKVHYFH